MVHICSSIIPSSSSTSSEARPLPVFPTPVSTFSMANISFSSSSSKSSNTFSRRFCFRFFFACEIVRQSQVLVKNAASPSRASKANSDARLAAIVGTLSSPLASMISCTRTRYDVITLRYHRYRNLTMTTCSILILFLLKAELFASPRLK
jgi:hypothetical protein